MFVKVLKKKGNDVVRIYLGGNLVCESVIDDSMTKQERKELNEKYIEMCKTKCNIESELEFKIGLRKFKRRLNL